MDRSASLAISCAALVASVAALSAVVQLATHVRSESALAPAEATTTRVVHMRRRDVPTRYLGSSCDQGGAEAHERFALATGIPAGPGINLDIQRFPRGSPVELLEIVYGSEVRTRILVILE